MEGVAFFFGVEAGFFFSAAGDGAGDDARRWRGGMFSLDFAVSRARGPISARGGAEEIIYQV